MEHAQVSSSPPCRSSAGHDSGAIADLLYGKTSPEPSAATPDATLQQWLTQWRGWKEPESHPKAGARKAAPSAPKQWSSGQLSTRSGSEWRSGAVACSLSQILETGEIDPQYFLSPKACAGILRRAEKRGKTLPTALLHALQAVAGVLNAPAIPEAKAPLSQSPSLCADAKVVEQPNSVETSQELFEPAAVEVTTLTFSQDCDDLF